MAIKSAILVLLFGLFFTPIANAGDTQVLSSLALSESVRLALANNPSITAAHEATNAAKSRPAQAASPDDPTVGVMFEEVPRDTADVGQAMVRKYFVQQKIPFPGKLVSGYKAAKARARGVAEDERGTRADLVRDVKRAYADLYAAQENIGVSLRTQAILFRAKKVAEESYAAGVSEINDPVKASVELGMVEQDIALLEQEKASALAMLQSFINQPISSDVRVRRPELPNIPGSIESMIEEMKALKPEVAASRASVKEGKYRLSLAHQQFVPDFTVEYRYEQWKTQQNAWTGIFGMTVPLYGFAKQRGQVNEARAMLNAAKKLEIQSVLTGEAALRDAYARVLAAKRIIKVLSGEVIPRTKIALDSSEEAYRAKKTDFLNIADNIRENNYARLALIRAEAGYVKAYADLERAIGSEFEGGGS